MQFEEQISIWVRQDPHIENVILTIVILLFSVSFSM